MAEEKKRKGELQSMEGRIMQREESLHRRNDALDKRERQLSASRASWTAARTTLTPSKESRPPSSSASQASLRTRRMISSSPGFVLRAYATRAILRESEQNVRAKADKTAREIISTAIQRCAADQAGEITVTTVHIPSDDLKGRIIGREGRNIRTFEQVSGVSLVIDDTPETVVLSSFDPVRRETARVALENLIADGRIHPARIEELYKKAEDLVNERVREAGEQAAFDAGIHDLHPEIVKTLGALKYRTSFGQNVLSHSIQVSALCGIMASELGLESCRQACRPSPRHWQGYRPRGRGPARRHWRRPRPSLRRALRDRARHRGHHADVDPDTVLDVLVQAADAISAARPGARREVAETYIKRLEKLEETSNAHEGVERTYAMQAGRELHVMVSSQKISDAQATVLAHDIAKQIEDEMEYPGQVRVVVIRESRAVDVAK